MGNIALLDELTINKIAAGEVIERPASVIKEMIENSIDAKATNITIEIKNGGISYIKITDNGKGIAKDDLEMAFERHATSKIRSAQDLEKVTTMGFRGEALASIAAISEVELISKTADQETGYKVDVLGGNILEKHEVGCQTGTTITVQNLFFNTPVRYKFLKKDYTETGYIEDVVTRIALVNPHISFKLINMGKTIIQTPGNSDLKSVIYSIYGKDIAQGVMEVNYNYEDIKITGVIGTPEIARSNRSNQLFFVNKRYVKDKILTAATEQAYKGIIDAGKYGFAVLNIEMNPSKVDVNVHPAKLEVRFQEESKIFQAIFHAIKDTMAKGLAANDTTTKVDNIIIQSSNNTQKNIYKEPEEKTKSTGLFSWRKNKTDKLFAPQNNIIEDLYNMKKVDETPIQNEEEQLPKAFSTPVDQNTDDTVNTSDVLKELKQINENVKKEIEETSPKIINTEEKAPDLPDGTTYTYVGENKEKIEDLLRQLHPETYKQKEQELVEEITEQAVAEESNNYELEFNIPKENLVELAEQPGEQNIAEVTKKTSNEQQIEAQEENTQTQESQIQEPEEQQVQEERPQEEQISEPTQEIKIPIQPSAEFSQMYEKLFGTPVIQEKPEEKAEEEKISAVDIIKDNVSVFEGIEEYQKPTYKFIGIVFETYIVAEIEKEMYIINQRTAKEKIIFEKLKNNYYNQVNKDSQMLLLPDIIELSNKQIEVIKENQGILNQAGFSFEEFGENTIKLTGVPTICLELDTKQLFISIINEINTVARTSKHEKVEKFIATIASKITQKANLAVSIQEIDNLMDELLRLPNPFVYEFDKPIAIKMTKYDIERKFSRK